MRISLLILALLIAMIANARADWVWSSETGWINSKYAPRGTAKNLYRQGKDLFDAKKYQEALAFFLSLIELHPHTPEAKDALYWAAECQRHSGNHYEAYLLYEKYRGEYPATPRLQEILQKEYEIGVILIRGKGKNRSFIGLPILSSESTGMEILDKLVKSNPYAPFADDAQLTIANYHFKDGDYKQAQSAYLRLAKDYPKSEWAEIARYQVAICSFRQFRGLPYDSESLFIAQQKFDEYFLQYPHGRQINVARKQHESVRELLAQKEYQVAIYYLDHDHIPSAKIYLRFIIRKYPKTETAKLARSRLAKLEKSGKKI